MKIYTKSRFIFFVLFSYITFFFISYFMIQKDEHVQLVKQRYENVAIFLMNHLNQNPEKHLEDIILCDDVNRYLNDAEMKIILDKEKHKYLEKKGRVLFHEKRIVQVHYKIVAFHAKFYLYIEYDSIKIWLRDKKILSFFWQIILVYLLMIVILFLLYIWFMRSIKPLKKLSKQVEKIRDGDMTISTKLIQTDEVGIVANTLDEALRRIEAMINTRQLFLRAIAHELNTPVAKGKLLTTFVKNREQQEEYHRVFERLEILIKEFFKIGQLFSSNYKIVARKYYISDLVEQAVELMLLSSEEMKNIHYIYEEETQIFTDFDLTALAIKNLIDNALKYSDNHEVTISIKKHGVTLCSKGKQCIKLLDPYREPFHKEKKSGFGLGLYIVHNISDMLSLKFTYVYQEGENCFLIYQEGFKK